MKLMKGNDAVVRGAILAGCRAYYGYPITPASEIAESSAIYFPRVGGTFLQAESEIGAINMCYGAASAGQRVMTASSGPGISLMQEALSYAAGAELPFVLVDIMRAGPGLGNIAPEQADYFQVVKGGGHGSYRMLTLAPASVQEMCDLTFEAFDLADRYRNPVVVLADAFIGQMMEQVEFPEARHELPEKPWAVGPEAERRDNLISSIYLEPDDLEAHIRKLYAKYAVMEREEVRYESYLLDDAEQVLVGYGIVARVLKTVVDDARRKGIKVGLLRPITLWPFPTQAVAALAKQAREFLVVEASMGQMVEDVRLAVSGRVPVRFHGRVGGNVPTVREVLNLLLPHDAGTGANPITGSKAPEEAIHG
ncbi:MAG: 3-methyl-2-oxobutanoate dehydrogenase subunit VorB [Candidatus Eisenbacteria bacterium]|nr:3-methyl-2-oxobutanoate dehydrogenase subunit VorB [Candidatus Eisenbacteria bacterium]